MARTDATILLTLKNNNVSGNQLEVVATKGVFILAYRGEPVGLRTRDFGVQGEFFLYPRSVFINRGHCDNLVRKMNAKFGCDDFSCIEMYCKPAAQLDS